MKEVFQSIADKLQSAVPAIRWTDFDLGQLQQEKPPVSFPCALVGFPGAVYVSIGPTATEGELTIEITLAFRVWERTHSVNSPVLQAAALEHLDTLEAVRLALTNLEGDTFSALHHTGTTQSPTPDPRTWRLRFACAHYPAPPAAQYVPWADSGAVTAHPDLMLMPDMVAAV